jgi:hypothetical protein
LILPLSCPGPKYPLAKNRFWTGVTEILISLLNYANQMNEAVSRMKTRRSQVQPFEKLGAFYLGKEYDLPGKKLMDNLVMYDARDLTTHAVCVGMTGSGKTGLCIDLLEEAAIDNVPALIIDPKGDMTNLLLTFPELRAEDFSSWINVEDAGRKGLSVPEYARLIADTWRSGLADWGEGPDRIRLLGQSAEFRIYTPGSEAGLPVSILASLRAPGMRWEDHQEVLREKIQGTVSALLGLVGIDADPLRSREHILLAHIFENAWREGKDLDLGGLIQAIQRPPVRRLGVFDVDTFFPEKDRFELAMGMNNLMASPSFETWLQGEPLDVAHLLHSPSGKPRQSIFYIAHLSDSERMFFVTLLLEQILTWMRQQSGTTSLRALLYMDEVFGFFPPVSNPPSKKPLLTLMKQARAFGLGVVLTTQNPVDLDYKGLSNAGTWFIGKLQTERDKNRLLDGLESAAGEAGSVLDRRELETLISKLGSRVFLLHNVHETRPVVFQTRWSMSYLRGPLTRSQVGQLMDPMKERGASPTPEPTPPRPAEEGRWRPEGYTGTQPTLPLDLPQAYLPVRVSSRDAVGFMEEKGLRPERASPRLIYEPALLALGEVSFVDRTRRVNETRRVGRLVPAEGLKARVSWKEAEPVELRPEDLDPSPERDGLFAAAPSALNSAAEIHAYAKDFNDYLYREETLELYYHPTLQVNSRPGETERDFRVQLQQLAREKRDSEVERLREKYRKQLDRLEERLEKEQRELAEDEDEYRGRQREELISGAETLIGLLGIFGRKRSTGFSKAATKRRLTSSAKARIEESKAQIARLQAEIEGMQRDMEKEAESITQKWTGSLDQVETLSVRPKRTDVRIDLAGLVWVPFWILERPSEMGMISRRTIPAWTGSTR